MPGRITNSNLKHECIYFFSDSFPWNFSVVISFQQHIEECQSLLSFNLALLVVIELLFSVGHFRSCPISNLLVNYLKMKNRWKLYSYVKRYDETNYRKKRGCSCWWTIICRKNLWNSLGKINLCNLWISSFNHRQVVWIAIFLGKSP